MIINWLTYIAPYCQNYNSRAIDKDCMKNILNKYVFNRRLNESSVGISMMLSGELFQAVDPATQKARSPNLVKDDRLGTASQTLEMSTQIVALIAFRSYLVELAGVISSGAAGAVVLIRIVRRRRSRSKSQQRHHRLFRRR